MMQEIARQLRYAYARITLGRNPEGLAHLEGGVDASSQTAQRHTSQSLPTGLYRPSYHAYRVDTYSTFL